MSLSTEEKIRYSRQMTLRDFGEEGQWKLKNSSVLVVGAGGLGVPVLQYLTAAGVGKIGVADHDVVDVSNLQRQVIYAESDVGKQKAKTVVEKLRKQNHFVEFEAFNFRLRSDNARELIRLFDVVVDGTDNFPTRYLLNDACVLEGKPLIYGSIYQFEGQVSVFNFQNGPNYRDLFDQPPKPGTVPDCETGGVLGVLPGIIGAVQANETMKVLSGTSDVLSGKLFIFDSLDGSSHLIRISKNPQNPVSGNHPTVRELIDYEAFCNTGSEGILRLGIEELKGEMKEGKEFLFVDVREPYEYEAGNIGGLCIPFAQLRKRLHEIPEDKSLVVVCRSGRRSGEAVRFLQANGRPNAWTLEGGLLAWKEQIDSDLIVL